MTYVVTFEHWNGTYKTYSVESSNIDLAIIDAKDEAREKYKIEFSDSDILSVIRICLKKENRSVFLHFGFSLSNSFNFSLRDAISSFCLDFFLLIKGFPQQQSDDIHAAG